MFSSFFWTRLLPMVARATHDIEPESALTLDYACSEEGALLTREMTPLPAIGVIGTFTTPEAAHEALTRLHIADNPVEQGTVFGHSLLVSVPGNQEAASLALQERLQELGGRVLVEHPEAEKAVSASLSCQVQDDAAAALLAAELQTYFDAPASFYLRPPWVTSSGSSVVQQQAEQRARATYHRLLRHAEQLRSEAPYRQLLQAYMRAGWQRDSATIETTLQSMAAYEKTSQQLMIARLLQGHDPDIDIAVVRLYQQYMDNERNLPGWEKDMGQRLGQLPLGDGGPQGEAALLAASAGFVRQYGNELSIDYIVFDRTQLGLPALARYLCSRGCTDIKYGLVDFDTIRGD